jgi:hypothetical protein
MKDPKVVPSVTLSRLLGVVTIILGLTLAAPRSKRSHNWFASIRRNFCRAGQRWLGNIYGSRKTPA